MRSRHPRGSTLLMATGVVALASVGVFVSLNAVMSESALQGDERRGRAAFFAAEAALAEGREKMRILVGTDPTYTGALGGLGAYVSEPGLPANELYDVLGWTTYPLTTTGPDVALGDDERVAPSGRGFELPSQLNVRYRVFAHDNDDGDGSLATDSDKRIWLVAVGEVASARAGAMPVRSVVRTLIRTSSGAPSTPGYSAQKGQGSDKAFTSNDAAAIAFGTTTF